MQMIPCQAHTKKGQSEVMPALLSAYIAQSWPIVLLCMALLFLMWQWHVVTAAAAAFVLIPPPSRCKLVDLVRLPPAHLPPSLMRSMRAFRQNSRRCWLCGRARTRHFHFSTVPMQGLCNKTEQRRWSRTILVLQIFCFVGLLKKKCCDNQTAISNWASSCFLLYQIFRVVLVTVCGVHLQKC